MSNNLSKMRDAILAGLAKAPAVRLECIRAKKLARELRRELRMCDIVVEAEDSVNVSPKGVRATPGVLRITWKTV